MNDLHLYNILGPLNMHSKHYLRHDCHCRAGHPLDQQLLNTLKNHVVSCKNIITLSGADPSLGLKGRNSARGLGV